MTPAVIVLTDADRATLRMWAGAGSTEQRLALRARVILNLAEGRSNQETARRTATRLATVSKWRGRFARAGLRG